MPSVLALDREAGARRSRYDRLITLDIRHSYYQNGGEPPDSWRDRPCRDLVIRPTAETAARLASLGLLLRPRADGMDILYTGGQAAALKSRIDALFAAFPDGLPPEVRGNLFSLPLLFTISLANPNFLNFTDMPNDFGCGRRALALSNLRVDRVIDESADLVVDWNRHIDLIRPRRPREAHESPPVHAAAAIHADGIRAVWHHLGKAEAAAAAADRTAVHTNAAQFPFALLDLHIVRPIDLPADVPGLFPVDLRPDAERRATSDGYLQPLRYDLCFAARETHWRYVIAARHGRLPDDLAIVDRDLAVNFAPCEAPQAIPGGSPPICLAADKAIVLRQRPAPRFALHGTPVAGRGRSFALVDPLPVPSPQTPTASVGGWSDIYVFV